MTPEAWIAITAIAAGAVTSFGGLWITVRSNRQLQIMIAQHNLDLQRDQLSQDQARRAAEDRQATRLALAEYCHALLDWSHSIRQTGLGEPAVLPEAPEHLRARVGLLLDQDAIRTFELVRSAVADVRFFVFEDGYGNYQEDDRLEMLEIGLDDHFVPSVHELQGMLRLASGQEPVGPALTREEPGFSWDDVETAARGNQNQAGRSS